MKKKQTHRYTELMVTGGKKEEGSGKITNGRGLRVTNYKMYKINKLQGYIVQHRKYSQYFISIM